MALSVDVIFSIGLAVILIVGTWLVIGVVFPYLGSEVACQNGQIEHIIEINDVVKDVKLTGITQIMKFKVENCVKCMWYFGDEDKKLIKIKWTTEGDEDEPQNMEVDVVWNNFGEDTPPKPNKKNCDDNDITGNKWCTLEVSPNRVNVVGDC